MITTMHGKSAGRGRWARSGSIPGAMLLASLLGAGVAQAMAGDVYRTVGEHGEASFTDEAVAGAERLRLDVPQAPAGAAEEAERRIGQTLEVARALEASRLAREAASAAARAQAPAPAPSVTIEREREPAMVFPYPYRFATAPDRRHHRGWKSTSGPPREGHRERTIAKRMIWNTDEAER